LTYVRQIKPLLEAAAMDEALAWALKGAISYDAAAELKLKTLTTATT